MPGREQLHTLTLPRQSIGDTREATAEQVATPITASGAVKEHPGALTHHPTDAANIPVVSRLTA